MRYYRICPVCEPDADPNQEALEDAIAEFADAADPTCWRCEGNGLLVGEPDEWDTLHEAVVQVGE